MFGRHVYYSLKGEQYLFVDAMEWRAVWSKERHHGGFELVSLHRAERILREVARERRHLLQKLCNDFTRSAHTRLDPPQQLQRLLRGLGHPPVLGETYPRSAKFYVLRRPITQYPAVAPLPEMPEDPTLEAAQAPRTYVAVETFDEDEKPVRGVRLEVLCADGDLRSATTNEKGVALVRGIPQGEVHIRLPDRHGESWYPDSGPPSSEVEPGRKQVYVVRQGESLAPLVGRHGMPSWDHIWQAPENDALREKRKTPRRLQPGDELTIPPRPLHEVLRPTDQTHRLIIPPPKQYVAHVLKAEDLLFHHDSAVFLGETGELTAGEKARGESGVDVLATALRHAEAFPDRKLLVVGHTDASGSEGYNQKLSEKRASSILHLLKGERDAWASLSNDESTPRDAQQILGWFAVTLGWPCAPMEVGADDPDDDERIVRAFQASYNKHFDGDLTEDGLLGPNTWGAIFDVYQRLLQERLETDEEGLQTLRDGLTFVDAGPVLGCGEWLPLDATAQDESADGQSERAAQNRRVELLFFEPSEQPPDGYMQASADCKLCDPWVRFEPIGVEPGPALVWVSLQTVDELGFRLPEVELVFRSGGQEVKHSTDGHGVWQGRVRADRAIEVAVADGRAIGFGAATEATDSAQLAPKLARSAVTSLVVTESVDAELLRAHRAYVQRHDAAPPSLATTLRSRGDGDNVPREPLEQPSADGSSSVPSRRARRANAADNLFMAADLDMEKLPGVIKTWLGDYYEEVLFHDYILEVVHGNQIAVVDSEGGDIGLFELKRDVTLRYGRTGLHALLEAGLGRDGQGAMFLDLATGRTWVDLGPAVCDPEEQAERTTADSEKEGVRVVDVAEVIAEKDRGAYLDAILGARARGQHRLLYLWRPDSEFIAANGGTGMLEPYPQDDTLRDHVHARNRAVVHSAKKAYGDYIDAYIETVRAIHPDPNRAKAQDLPHPEKQLFDLLPPMSAPELPIPVGASESEVQALFGTDPGGSEFQAWKAISEKHNEIWGVRTAGAMWMAGEFAVEGVAGKGGGGKAVLKLNFEVSTEHTTDRIKVEPKAEYAVHLHNVELDPETGVVKGTLEGGKLGPFKADLDSTGKVTMHYGPAQASYDRNKEQVGVGGSLSLRDLVRDRMKGQWKHDHEPPWVKDMPDVKVELSLNMQLSRPSDIMSVVMRAGGLQERGQVHVFMTSDWTALTVPQRSALRELDFNPKAWDGKQLPDAVRQPYSALSGLQKQAVQALPNIPKEGGWVEFWKKWQTTR